MGSLLAMPLLKNILKFAVYPMIMYLLFSLLIGSTKKIYFAFVDAGRYSQQLDINEKLISENKKLLKRNEEDRIRHKKIRDDFRKRSYEEINRYKELLKVSDQHNEYYNLPIPDDTIRLRSQTGALRGT